MPLIHVDEDLLELIYDCLLECGHEDSIADIGLMLEDPTSEEEEPIHEDVGDQKKVGKKQRGVYQEG